MPRLGNRERCDVLRSRTLPVFRRVLVSISILPQMGWIFAEEPTGIEIRVAKIEV